MIEIFQDRAFENQTVGIDNKMFIRCKFINCTLVFQGEEMSYQECDLKDCKFVFLGAAQRTINFLLHQGWQPPRPLEEGKTHNFSTPSGNFGPN